MIDKGCPNNTWPFNILIKSILNIHWKICLLLVLETWRLFAQKSIQWRTEFRPRAVCGSLLNILSEKPPFAVVHCCVHCVAAHGQIILFPTFWKHVRKIAQKIPKMFQSTKLTNISLACQVHGAHYVVNIMKFITSKM